MGPPHDLLFGTNCQSDYGSWVRNQSRHPHFTLRAGIKKRKFGAGNAWLDFGSVEALPLHAARIAAAASGAGFRPLVLPSHAGNPQQDGQ